MTAIFQLNNRKDRRIGRKYDPLGNRTEVIDEFPQFSFLLAMFTHMSCRCPLRRWHWACVNVLLREDRPLAERLFLQCLPRRVVFLNTWDGHLRHQWSSAQMAFAV
jgi:hypothetical protein